MDVQLYCINGSWRSPEKKFSINFTRANAKCCFGLHYNSHNSYLFVNRKEIFMFKADNKKVDFPTQFCLGSLYNGFSNTDSREIYVYSFSVDYNSIDKYS